MAAAVAELPPPGPRLPGPAVGPPLQPQSPPRPPTVSTRGAGGPLMTPPVGKLPQRRLG